MNLSEIIKSNFPGTKFTSSDIKSAGKRLKKGDDAAIEFLQSCSKPSGNIKPPAKCIVVGSSRPFDEFDIVKASNAVQYLIYNSAKDSVDKWSNASETDVYPKKLQLKEEHELWAKETGFNLTYKFVQSNNLIFKHAINRYYGVIKKVENRNSKLKKRLKAFDKEHLFKPESALDDKQCLLQKPGINPNIYCPQGFSLRAVLKDDLKNLPDKFSDYNLDPDAPIKILGHTNRISIPKGDPGHIPLHHRLDLNPGKRIRKYKSSANDMLLFILDIKGSTDWILCDARGLLRNARYRGIVDKTCTLNSLLSLFTGDPVIDTTRNVASLSFKEGSVKVFSKKKTIGKRTKEVIQSLASDNGMALAAIDLGQINPVSVGLFKVDKNLKSKKIESFFIKDELKNLLIKNRTNTDALEEGINLEALSLLKPEYQQEFKAVKTQTSSDIKQALITRLSLVTTAKNCSIRQDEWDKMCSVSSFISDYLIKNNREDIAYQVIKSKTGKESKRKILDINWYNSCKKKISKDAREAFSSEVWKLKISSKEYNKLSKMKLETSRRIVNSIVKESKEKTGCTNVAIAVEDLTLDNRWASGSGKRELGWDNFGTAKKENRWFLQVLHKAIIEQSINHGIDVLEVNKSYTSQTCPKCDHCDPKSRSEHNRQKFNCTKCGASLNADLDVATFNIARVALSGIKLKGPVKEEKIKKSSAKKNPVPPQPSRKKKSSSKINSLENVTALDFL